MSQPETEISELMDAIIAAKVRRAMSRSMDQRMLDGPRLIESSREMMRKEICAQFRYFSAQQVESELRRRRLAQRAIFQRRHRFSNADRRRLRSLAEKPRATVSSLSSNGAIFSAIQVRQERSLLKDKLTLIEILVVGLDCKGCCLCAYDSIYRLGRVTPLVNPEKIDRIELEMALKQRGVQLKSE